jgi:hypothetical protein
MTVREQGGLEESAIVGVGDSKPNIPDVAMVALVARAFCARPAVMMICVLAVMQLVAPPDDLDGFQRHDRDVVAGNEGILGLGKNA